MKTSLDGLELSTKRFMVVYFYFFYHRQDGWRREEMENGIKAGRMRCGEVVKHAQKGVEEEETCKERY